MSAAVRVSKESKRHDKYRMFEAVYGLGLFVPIIDQDEAIQKQPKYVEPMASANNGRSMTGTIFKLPKVWAWQLDCQHTFGSTKIQAVADLEMLLQVKFSAEWSTDLSTSNIQLGFGHQGIMKELRATLDTTTDLRVVCQLDGNQVVVINDQPQVFLDDQRLVQVINQLWDAPSSLSFEQILHDTFPKDKQKQIALLFICALNNLILKSSRNEIEFI